MGKIFKLLPLLFGAIFILLLILSFRLMLSASSVTSGDAEDLRAFHYAFYLPESDSSFFKQLKNGALDATDALDCAVSFHLMDEDNSSFEFATYSGVDGLAVYLYREDEEILKTLSMIADSGTPIVQIERSVDLDDNTFFIGTNSFETGKAMGTLASRLEEDALNLALIYSEKNPGLLYAENLIEMGLKSVLDDRAASMKTYTTSLNPLDAEKYTYDLLRNNPETDLILLTDPNDTLVTVQAIIDMNLVGRISIIGFGENEEIQEYIEKKIIMGTIVRNPYRIGYSTVMALVEISTNGYTSAYVDTGINVITQPEEE